MQSHFSTGKSLQLCEQLEEGGLVYRSRLAKWWHTANINKLELFLLFLVAWIRLYSCSIVYAHFMEKYGIKFLMKMYPILIFVTALLSAVFWQRNVFIIYSFILNFQLDSRVSMRDNKRWRQSDHLNYNGPSSDIAMRQDFICKTMGNKWGSKEALRAKGT